MAEDVVIRAEGLGKKYMIGHAAERDRNVTLRDVLARGARDLCRKTADVVRGRAIVAGGTVEEFWALKDVSFEVRRGEVLGIIGRNGAGKSTLLKILSRITEPSEGEVTIDGRVASLLEVGTGFHPELTGRENIYLNGAILGMGRAEIRRKFDEIVAFAEVEKFLDTPVKRYSSGMYVRLAFAVAAHLEPEILIVDEVLAVGDQQFQEKCLGKMDDVAKGGRTVIVVTHDMRRATALCSRGMLLDAGAIAIRGAMAEIADRYLSRQLRQHSVSDLSERSDRSGSGEAQFQSAELLRKGEPCSGFTFGDPLTQRITIQVNSRVGILVVHSHVISSDGVRIHEFYNDMGGNRWAPNIGTYTLTLNLPRLALYPGTYTVDLWLGDKYSSRVDYVPTALIFSVAQPPPNLFVHPLDRANGLVYTTGNWTSEQLLPNSKRSSLPLTQLVSERSLL